MLRNSGASVASISTLSTLPCAYVAFPAERDSMNFPVTIVSSIQELSPGQTVPHSEPTEE